jgi:uncharacterized protein YndB with AHSA1/START domain
MKTGQKELKMELRGETEVVFTRYFAAPRELVFDCFTKPELMRRWLIGPEGMVLEVRENDLRAGGKYLYVYANPEGKAYGVYGTFREVIVPEKLANTENYAMDMSSFDPNVPEDPNASVESRTFTTEGEFTLMIHVCSFASAEERQMVLESGMAEGWASNCLELDRLLLEIV